MVELLPGTLPTPSGQSAVSAQSALAVRVPEPPTALLRLPIGSQLEASVAGRDGQGQLLLKTELGTFAVASRAALAKGSLLTLQIRAGSPFVILLSTQNAAGGRARSDGPTTADQNKPSQTTQSAGNLLAQAAKGDVLSLGQPLMARVLAPKRAVSTQGLPQPGQASGGQSAASPPSAASGATGQAPVSAPTSLEGQIFSAWPQRLAPGFITQALNQVVQGQVQATLGGGQVEIATPQGTVVLSLPSAGGASAESQAVRPGLPSLPPGTPVELRVIKAPSGVLQVEVTLKTTPSNPTAGGAGAGATVPNAAGATLPVGDRPVSPGTSLALANDTLAAATVATEQAAATKPVPGSSFLVRALAVAPHAASLGATPPNAGGADSVARPSADVTVSLRVGQEIMARVTGTTASGQPIVSTSLGSLALSLPNGENPAGLTLGSQIRLEILQDPRPLPPLLPASNALEAGAARTWPELFQAFEALGALGGAPAAVDALSLPQAGPRLTTGLLFFLAALQGGKLDGWPGQAGRELLERIGQSELVNRLGPEMLQGQRVVAEGGSEWRLFLLPFFDGSKLQPLRFLLRGRDGKKGGDPEPQDKAIRFLLELELSRMGALQFDGLVRNRRFDLMLRSRWALSAQQRADIAEIFDNANTVSGYRGQITFQSPVDWRPTGIEDVIEREATINA